MKNILKLSTRNLLFEFIGKFSLLIIFLIFIQAGFSLTIEKQSAKFVENDACVSYDHGNSLKETSHTFNAVLDSIPDVYYCGSLFDFHQATSNSPDSIYFDIFGNSYDIYPSGRSVSTITTHEVCYFNISFDESGGSFSSDFIETTLDAFEGICDLIEQRSLVDPCSNSIDNVDINITISWVSALGNTEVAAASPMYYPTAECNGSIRLEPAYTKINGGYLKNNSINDGLIWFNPYFEDDLFLDYPNAVTSGKYDLYSIMQHEALHVLGFNSSFPNTSYDYFNQYDRLLNVYDAPDYNYLIENDCESECYTLENYTGGQVNSLAGTDCTIQVGKDGPFAVSTTLVSGLSHLDGGATCGSVDYLMKEKPLTGVRAQIQPEEINILCLLGYKVDDGTTSCDGCYLLPMTDIRIPNEVGCGLGDCCIKEYYTCGDVITIPYSDLLCMVLSSEGAEITNVDVGVNASVSMEDDEVVVTFTGGVNADRIVILNYYVTGCDECRTLSNSTVTLFFDNCLELDCEYSDPCENTLCFDDYENLSIGDGYNFGYHYIFEGRCNNSPDIESDGTYKYLLIADGESSTFKINEGPYNGCEYDLDITFKLSSTVSNLQVWLSKVPPCQNEFVPYGCDNIAASCNDGSVYEPECLMTISGTSYTPNTWYTESFPVSSSSVPNDAEYIIFSVNDGLSYASAKIREVSLVPTCDPNPIITVDVNCNEVCFNVENAGGSYEWDFDDSNTSSEISPCHEFATSGTYYVEVTVTGPCGEIFEDEFTVVVPECEPMDLCDEHSSETPDYTIGSTVCDESYASTESLTTFYSNKKFKINGTLFLDQNLSVAGCIFEMGPHSEIVVKPGKSFYADGCDFYSCDYMWRSIRVAPGGTLYLGNEIDNNRIQDAWAGVFAHSKSNLSLSGTEFDRNMIGVYIPPGFDYEAEFPPFPFSNTIKLTRFSDLSFDCTSNLLPVSPTICDIPTEDWEDENFFVETPLQTSYAGVVVYDINSISLGGPSIGFNNQYRNLNNGIVAFNTNIRVENSSFKHMPRNNNYTIRGNGIYMNGKHRILNQIGYGKYGMPSFDDVRIAIFCKGASLYSKSNNMLNVNIGHYTQVCKNKRLNIGENNIEAERFGIVLSHNDPTLKLDVYNNEITLTGSTPTFPFSSGYAMSGIQINEMNQPHQIGFNYIRKNVIHVGNGLWGILDESSTRLNLEDNVIDLGTDRAIAGIGHFNGNESIIRKNAITGSGISSSGLFSSIGNNGIYSFDSPLSYYVCNTLEELRDGLSINDLCLTSIIGRNKFLGQFKSGLYYNDLGFSGPQYNTLNIWPGPTVGVGDNEAKHQSNTNWVYSRYFYDELLGVDYYPDPVTPEDNWFKPSSTYSEPKECNEFIWNERFFIVDSLDYLIAHDSIEPDEAIPALTWNLENHLYSYLMTLDSTDITDTVFHNFLANNDTSEIGKWNKFAVDLTQSLTLDTSIQIYIESYEDTLLNRIGSIWYYQNVIDTTTSSVDSLAAIGMIDSLTRMCDTSMVSWLGIMYINDSLSTITWMELANQLDGLPNDQDWTESLQTVWSEYLEWLISDDREMESTSITSLESLSGECSRNLGKAVYLAGSFRKYLLNILYLYDCPIPAKPTSIGISSLKLREMTLSPNPAKGIVSVGLSGNEAKGVVRVFDTSGKELYMNEVFGSTFEIRLDKFYNGIYYVQWTSGNEPTLVKKLSVLR